MLCVKSLSLALVFRLRDTIRSVAVKTSIDRCNSNVRGS